MGDLSHMPCAAEMRIATALRDSLAVALNNAVAAAGPVDGHTVPRLAAIRAVAHLLGDTIACYVPFAGHDVAVMVSCEIVGLVVGHADDDHAGVTIQ